MQGKFLKQLFQKKENELFSVEVRRTNERGCPTQLRIDGVDIADRVAGFKYEITGNGMPMVTLKFPANSIDISGVTFIKPEIVEPWKAD